MSSTTSLSSRPLPSTWAMPSSSFTSSTSNLHTSTVRNPCNRRRLTRAFNRSVLGVSGNSIIQRVNCLTSRSLRPRRLCCLFCRKSLVFWVMSLGIRPCRCISRKNIRATTRYLFFVDMASGRVLRCCLKPM